MGNGPDRFDIKDYLGGARPPAPGGSSSAGPPDLASRTQAIEFSRPRTGWLMAAAASAGCGLVLAVCGLLLPMPAALSVSTAFVAWVLAAPGAIGLLAAYRHLDAQEQAKPGYAVASGTRALGVAVPVLIVVAAVASSLRIAEWAGRQ
jgi:hypothetical protein